jgi:alpha-1,3-mannosyltransferase
LDSHFIITTVFTSNFIGIVFARTLHYQFYVWYFHTLPFLLWHTQLPTAIRLFVMAAIEVSFNVYPATYWSSLLLQAAHITLLVALYLSPAPLAQSTPAAANGETTTRIKSSSIRKWTSDKNSADKSD